MLKLAETEATAGLSEMPVWLDPPGQLGPQVPRALLDLFERARPHSQTRPRVPAPAPKWLARLKAYASRRRHYAARSNCGGLGSTTELTAVSFSK
jgi:hypothetical protein